MKPYNFPAGRNSSDFLNSLNLNNLRNAMKFGNGDDAKTEMTEVANASRPLWVRNRLIGGNSAPLSLLFSRIKDDSDGTWMAAQIPVLQGASGIYDQKPKAFPLPSKTHSKTKGKGIGSVDYWEILGSCEHNHGAAAIMQPFPLGPVSPGLVYSSSENSEHNLHDSDSDHALDVDELLGFMRFGIEAEGSYRQPVVYRHFQKDLSLSDESKRMPWDIFDSGKFIGGLLGKGQTSDKLRLVSSSEGHSLSKAVVYYHHPGNWREPPNFWNPFWRVKLHPFSTNELVRIEALSGQKVASIAFNSLKLTLASGDQAMEGV
jgi:hypothetical protein